MAGAAPPLADALAWMRWHLGLPPPETSMEETSMEALLATLEEETQSGVKYVYRPGKRF